MTESLFERFAAQAQSHPDAPALIWEGETISYGELAEMAATAYDELERSELPEDRPVGIRARKSPEAIALVLACLRAQRPFLLPSSEQAATSLVLEPHGPRSQSASLRAIDDAPAEEETPVEWPPVGGADDISFMLTTSGSTGLPKIVPLPAGAVDRSTDWAPSQGECGAGTVVANSAPLT